MSVDYNFTDIEPKWQSKWKEIGLFKAKDFHDSKDKFYCLMMYPYPSGTLHVGHGRNYIIGDAVTRYLMMRGKNVMTPMGWDSFGLPAENYAIKMGKHPNETTKENIAKMKKQFEKWGVLYDWDREVTTSSPEYYRWTQWIFQQMYDKGLAYRKNAPVNWCESCATVLANEQVIDGKCERCGSVILQKDMEQWFFRITHYAQELLDALDDLDWPDRVKAMQRHWIGRSEGCFIDFPVVGDVQAPQTVVPDANEFPMHGTRKDSATDEVLMRVFTTRPDTVYGVTFMAIAPEHPIVEHLLNSKENTLSDAQKQEVRTFIQDVRTQSAFERESDSGEKKGMFLGRYVHNPLYPEDKRFEIPLYVGNYVLMYGTGLVMAVPAHDQRDFEFAKKKNLKLIKVIVPPTSENDEFPESLENWTSAFTGEGTSVNSTDETHNGLPTSEMKDAVADKLSEINRGGKTITYRLRDWLISRQRYWGCPIPMVYCDDCGVQKVADADLPVLLPMDIEFKGLKGNPLEASKIFQEVKCPKCGKPARRETDTMDTFVDSSWYFLRYLDSHNTEKIFDEKNVDYWMPIDQYIGGIEHATGHLIFARFFTKVFADLGLIKFREPFKKLFTQGMITKLSYFSDTLGFLRPAEVEIVSQTIEYNEDDHLQLATKDKPFVIHSHKAKKDGSTVHPTMEKMSKSKYNVVDPADLIEKYGADTERVYTLFIGPPAKDAYWDSDGIIGANRFLKRLWDIAHFLSPILTTSSNTNGLTKKFSDIRKITHNCIKKVTYDLENNFQFNTAIAQIMTITNEIKSACLNVEYFDDSIEKYKLVEKEVTKLTDGNQYALAEAITTAIKLIAPMAPHFAEEIWEHFGNKNSIFAEKWPVADEKWLQVDEIELPIQINGKVRSKITVAADANDAEVEKLALADEKVQKNIEGKKIIKFIIVKQKIINIIVK